MIRHTLEAFALALVATLAVALLPLLVAVAMGWTLAGLAWVVIGDGE